jgi:hypothetical protein
MKAEMENAMTNPLRRRLFVRLWMLEKEGNEPGPGYGIRCN